MGFLLKAFQTKEDARHAHGQGGRMESWRFLQVNRITCAETAIYRPVLMRAGSEGIAPDTVSFCTFPRLRLITTFFNDPEKDINLPFCRERGISVFRTLASGGPVFGDTGYGATGDGSTEGENFLRKEIHSDGNRVKKRKEELK
jgi:hypothetical protein